MAQTLGRVGRHRESTSMASLSSGGGLGNIKTDLRGSSHFWSAEVITTEVVRESSAHASMRRVFAYCETDDFPCEEVSFVVADPDGYDW
jgi:hypothetical protein